MAKIEIYSADYCPFCHRAKQLLASKNLEYTEIDVAQHPQKRQEMIARTNQHTIPQIFINDQSIGGCDDLIDLDVSGKLDQLIKSSI